MSQNLDFYDDLAPDEKPCPCGEGTTTLADCDGRQCGFYKVVEIPSSAEMKIIIEFEASRDRVEEKHKPCPCGKDENRFWECDGIPCGYFERTYSSDD